jgi:threonine/homoserine/homoserine lactone efflux protein
MPWIAWVAVALALGIANYVIYLGWKTRRQDAQARERSEHERTQEQVARLQDNLASLRDDLEERDEDTL